MGQNNPFKIFLLLTLSFESFSFRRNAPSKVKNLFKEASTQLKETFKNVSWQEEQKLSILKHKKENIGRLENEEKGHDLELGRLDKELEVMREEMRLLENEEKELMMEAKSQMNLKRKAPK